LGRRLWRWRSEQVELLCDEIAAARSSAPLDIADALVKLRRCTHALVPRPMLPALASRVVPDDHLIVELVVRRLGWRADIAPLARSPLALAAACRAPQRPEGAKGPETLSRTEFTGRIENFFEHQPLTPGKPTRFLIHLTDLSDRSPLEKAEVTLTVRPARGGG